MSTAHPVRVLAFTLFGVDALQLLLFAWRMAAQVMGLDRTVLWLVVGTMGQFFEVITTCVLLGLAWSADRWRGGLVALAVLATWVPALFHLQSFAWVPPVWMKGVFVWAQLFFVGALCGVAWVQSERPRWVVGALVLSLIVRILGIGLWHVDSDVITTTIGLLSGGANLVGLGLLGWFARAPRRSTHSWPLMLLGALPLVRIWYGVDLVLDGASGGASGLGLSVEAALLGLTAVAFWGVSRRGVSAMPLAGVIVGGMAVTAVAAGLYFQADTHLRPREEAMWLLGTGAGAGLWGLVVWFWSIAVLRRLAQRLDATHLVKRAESVAWWYAGACTVLVLAGAGTYLAPRSAWMVVLMALLVAAGLGLVGFVQWERLCFGLARRLEEPVVESEELWG